MNPLIEISVSYFWYCFYKQTCMWLTRDTAGKSRFESLGEMFLSEAMGVVFCYDISDRKSFQNLPHWMNKFIGKLIKGDNE